MSVVTAAEDSISPSSMEVLQSLRTSFDDLAALYAEHTGAENADETGSDSDDDPAAAVAAQLESFATEIDELESTFEDASNRLDYFEAFCGDEGRAWQAAFDQAIAAAEDAATVLVDESGNTVAALQRLQTSVEHQAQQLADLVVEIVQRIEKLAERVEGELKTAARATGEAFVDTLEDKCSAPLTEAYASTRAALEERLENTRDSVLQQVDQLSTEVTSLKDSLLQNIQQAVERSARTATHSLIDAASERLASTVAQSVMMTQLGSQLTSAMAPVLPQLIAINKLAEALREAIKIFKEMQRLASMGV